MTRDDPEVVGYRFGGFSMDLEERRLERSGAAAAIQDKPFELLVALLEQPGRIVSRDAIIRRLWPEGTFVDFERGLNTAVRKVRRALGDTARSPRYIETLPRRGYRFLVEVRPVHATSGNEPNPHRPPGLVPFTREVGAAAPSWRWTKAARLAVTCAGALFFVAVGMVLPRPGATAGGSGCMPGRDTVSSRPIMKDGSGCAAAGVETPATTTMLVRGRCSTSYLEPTSH